MRRAAAALLGLVLLASTPLAAAPPAVGDVNGDGSVDVLDVFALVNFLFAGGPAPVGSGDVDGDGAVTVADVFYFINFLFAGGPPPVASGWLDGWPTFAHDPAHTGRAPVAGQALASVHWSTPVDLASGTTQTHYGSPLITQDGNVVVTVKTGATDGFRVEGREPTGGSLIWQEPLDYALPPHNWIPVCQPTLTPENVLVMPASGGTVLRRASADAASSTLQRLAFYGLSEYESAAATYDGLVKINTPIVSDRRGNLYFGFVTLGATPANLTSGIARLGAGGVGTWTPVTAAANDAAMRQVVTNCAPALSADGNALYVAVRNGSSRGYLLRLDAGTLAPLSRVSLVDPKSGVLASLRDDGTSSPTVGPDGDVYCGVLENPTGFNHYRGWLLHFDAALATTKTPAEFGWDTTAAIVPASAVPSYAGSSSYLLFTKYNDYASVGGSGINRIAVLDPSETAVGPVTGATVMKEVLAIADPTPDPDHPGAVYEWCINAAAVDVAAKCVYANAEDGYLYRWDLATNTLSQAIQLSGGFFQAYTPTVVGKDGTVYAIQGGVLFAVGSAP